MSAPTTITELLRAWNSGDDNALDQLIPLVEKELRRIAARQMRGERENHTLQTTALVNEAFMRLVKQDGVSWQNRSHFFAIASQVMRRVLLDHAKSRRSLKRGAAPLQIELSEHSLISESDLDSLIALDEALLRLEAFDPVKSRIVVMRHFGGLSVEETAEVLGVAPVTVMRHWSLAKAWLRRELEGENSGD
ncbi:sigma-70 family RNA polymerase sigma factor [soil metagenome]